jgi:nuclear pore complex protein Nup62
VLGATTPAANSNAIAAASRQLANKSIEQIVNDWTSDLEKHVKLFTKQAVEVARWDRQVLENGQKIFRLRAEVEQVKSAQAELDRNLELIHTEQNELHELLTQMEAEVARVADSEPTAADAERDKGYRMAEAVCAQLDQLSGALEDVVARLNVAANTSSVPADDAHPMHHIVRILNNHQNALSHIDQQCAIVMGQLNEAQRVLR